MGTYGGGDSSPVGADCVNDYTLLYRVVNSNYVQNGQVSSQAFRPRPRDQKQLSVYDGDKINPADAWLHYTRDPYKASTRRLGSHCRRV